MTFHLIMALSWRSQFSVFLSKLILKHNSIYYLFVGSYLSPTTLLNSFLITQELKHWELWQNSLPRCWSMTYTIPRVSARSCCLLENKLFCPQVCCSHNCVNVNQSRFQHFLPPLKPPFYSYIWKILAYIHPASLQCSFSLKPHD